MILLRLNVSYLNEKLCGGGNMELLPLSKQKYSDKNGKFEKNKSRPSIKNIYVMGL